MQFRLNRINQGFPVLTVHFLVNSQKIFTRLVNVKSLFVRCCRAHSFPAHTSLTPFCSFVPLILLPFITWKHLCFFFLPSFPYKILYSLLLVKHFSVISSHRAVALFVCFAFFLFFSFLAWLCLFPQGKIWGAAVIMFDVCTVYVPQHLDPASCYNGWDEGMSKCLLFHRRLRTCYQSSLDIDRVSIIFHI